nr:transglutaminase family protein [uncultured Desulfuromonas sp.]
METNHVSGLNPPDTCKGMTIRLGYELVFHFTAPTPLLLMLKTHPSRASSLLEPDHLHTDPSVEITEFIDCFGNRCGRTVAPAGRFRIWTDALASDSGEPDPVCAEARQHPVPELPVETLPFLAGSRYCDTDRLTEAAWDMFGSAPEGWGRVQAICDWVHANIRFGYEYARPTMSAWDTFTERVGVCRDFMHLAISFCRCMNIPARYACGYLGDIGVPPVPYPMDFSAWFEAYLDGRWHTFDARHNIPRIGRVLMARGRDAGDVALTTAFGLNTLVGFTVWTDEVRH